MSKSDDYLWDKSGAPDPEVARLEALLSPLAHEAPLDELRIHRKRAHARTATRAIAAVALAAAAALVAVLLWPRGPDRPTAAYVCGAQATGFAFTARGGSVACGGANVPAGVLPVGGTLDTGAHEAELAIADIGSAQLSPKTRIRLDRTSAERHELYLISGRLHAVVVAPPRLFAVGTPSGPVTDLGCEYTLEIDDTGSGSVTVGTGMVELESSTGKVIVVPAGARARLLAHRRASLPLSTSASTALVAAVADLDAGVPGAVDRILATATVGDAITLANLARVAPDERKRAVLDRLHALVPPPQQMSVDDIVELDLFDMWFDEVVFSQMTQHH